MSEHWLVKAIGPRVGHVTMRANLDGIERLGLLPAVDLARRAGISPGQLVLRDQRMQIDGGGVSALINHQRSMVRGLEHARSALVDFTPESWARFLDERVFFWPEKRLQRVRKRLEAKTSEAAILWIDTQKLVETCGERLDLSPINSGNFRLGGARTKRSDWLFVSVRRGATAFRRNRMSRGLVKRPDRVAELAVSGPIPHELLEEIRLN